MKATRASMGVLGGWVAAALLAGLGGCASSRPQAAPAILAGPRVAPDATAAAPLEEKEEPPPETKHWVFWFEAGATTTGGNAVARDVDARLEAKRVWESDEVSAFIRGEYGEAEDEEGELSRNRNRQTASARYKHVFSDEVYAFAQEDLERDEFTDIRIRSQTWIGAGARIYKDDHHELNGEVSPGYVHTAYKNTEDEDSFSARAAEDYKWKISEKWTFVEKAEIISNLEEIDNDFRTVATADLRTDVTENIFLSFGVEHRYDSNPSLDDDGERLKRQDWKAMIKVGIRF